MQGAQRGWARLFGSGGLRERHKAAGPAATPCPEKAWNHRVSGALWVAGGVLGWETPGCPCAKALPSLGPVLGEFASTTWKLIVPSGPFSPPKLESLWYIPGARGSSGVEAALAQILLMVWPSRARTVKWTMQVQTPNLASFRSLEVLVPGQSFRFRTPEASHRSHDLRPEQSIHTEPHIYAKLWLYSKK